MRCVRCNGCLSEDADDIHCLNCGWYKVDPFVPTYTLSQPDRWRSVQCLCGRPAIDGREVCPICQGKRSYKSRPVKSL